MTRAQRRHAHCLDCGTPVDDNFCSHCGQENSDYRVSLRRLLGDLFEELFQLESRLWRSLFHLFRHPGQLTRDYNAGRRVRYTSPLRLYLIASVAYFFVAAVMPPAADSDLKVELDGGQVDFDHLPQPKSAFERRILDHVGIQAGADARAVQQHTRATLATNAPKVMALLVPLFALLTLLVFRKPRLFFVEHLTLALHLHAVAFWLLLLAALIHWSHAWLLALLAASVWLLLALRALFAQPWWLTIAKMLLLGLIYAALVAGGLLVALLI